MVEQDPPVVEYKKPPVIESPARKEKQKDKAQDEAQLESVDQSVSEQQSDQSDSVVQSPKENKTQARPKVAPSAAPDHASGGHDRHDRSKGKAKPNYEERTAEKKHSNRRNLVQKERQQFDMMLDADHPVRARRRKRAKSSMETHRFEKPVAPAVYDVKIPESIAVSDLAQKMSVKAIVVIKALMGMGVIATINQVIDQDTAVLVVEEMGHKPVLVKIDAIEDDLVDLDDEGGAEESRAPVVTIMGHVDHGKTSLLDYIRRAKVTEGEAGGITQHIGAYRVSTPKGDIAFLDTPGHAAFTAMRSRGANCTDIVILVVAADDGVMPQTKEAVEHAKAAGVPLVVAVNKMDKPEADPDRVKTELSQIEVISEEWGGDTMFVAVSAKTGSGIDDLLDAILLQSEVLELKAPVEASAAGVVIESRLDKKRGPVATLLVQKGTLRQGQTILAGTEFGRVRVMHNELGHVVDHAGPSTPVEVVGLSGTPSAGDDFIRVADEKKAKEVALYRQNKYRENRIYRQSATTLESLFENAKNAQDVQSLNVMVKADTQGSVEAICDSLQKLATDEIKVSIVASGTGGFNESDIHLAMASEAVMFGFNVRTNVKARDLAEKEGVTIRYYSVIYDLIDDVKKAMSGLLSPELREQIVGIAEVRDVFKSPKLGAIAGCMVTQGVVKRNNPIRVLRDEVVIYEGALESLRRFKDDAESVSSGKECGIGVKNYNDIKAGDQIEVYEVISVAREIK